MIEKISAQAALRLKAADPDNQESLATITYGIHVTLNALIAIVVCLVTGAILGRFVETAIALKAFVILRSVSGGYHMKSALGCSLATAVTMVAVSFSSYSPSITVAITAFSMVLVYMYAPSKIEHQTRIPKELQPYLKWISLVIVASNFVFMSPIIASSFALQSISLIYRKGEQA